MGKTVYDLILNIDHITASLNQSTTANGNIYNLHDKVNTLIHQTLPDFIAINRALKTNSTRQAVHTLQSAKSCNHVIAKVHSAFKLLKSALKQNEDRYLSPYPYSFLCLIWNNDLKMLGPIKIIIRNK